MGAWPDGREGAEVSPGYAPDLQDAVVQNDLQQAEALSARAA